MAGYLGLQFLGNLGKPLPMELLEALLRQFKRKSTGYPVKLSSTLECSDIAKNL
ncbi:hypothetical protein FBY09_15010 [Pseudomonas sp. SJZ101]|nr:hypothetical protein FBY00_15114 [Pseudomonas sp. SJZ075]TWC26634.1 hypothetical protein FBY02_15014 [Pseudomonas sp. SJZ078]TWC45359.1 hypothetical protein FBY11_1529 [Pseudomonas sp. SJZ124]TWC80440.1 hypothetical protein FBY09_15010 [Pseudomonas sp. SJZ101]